MIIGVDLDSVLNNLLDVWLEQYNLHYDDALSAENILTWDVHKYVKCGTRIYKYLNFPETYERCTPKPYSQDVTRELAKHHTLVCISTVAKGTYDVKKTWISNHFPWIEHFVGTHSKKFIAADVLIDDAIHNLVEFPGIGIVFDMPYNQEWQGTRVYDWRDVTDLITRIDNCVRFGIQWQ